MDRGRRAGTEGGEGVVVKGGSGGVGVNGGREVGKGGRGGDEWREETL